MRYCEPKVGEHYHDLAEAPWQVLKILMLGDLRFQFEDMVRQFGIVLKTTSR